MAKAKAKAAVVTRDRTAVKRQKDLAARNAKRGLVQTAVWVPEHRREELKALAAQWRSEHKLEGGE